MQNEWQRPQTTRRYLHPPKAERMFTLWKEGMVLFGEIHEPITAPYDQIISRGVWFTHGNSEPADFHTAENTLREDGIPVHGLKNKFGNLSVDLECFASFERCPTCYIQAIVTNDSSSEEHFGFLLRTAKECELVVGAPDIYQTHSTNINAWKTAPVTFHCDGATLRDGEFFLSAPGFVWDDATGHASAVLAPGETKTFCLAFGKGAFKEFDYNTEKTACIAAWNNELTRINNLPVSIRNNAEIKKTIQHLTIQMLQCFSTSVGTNHLYPRQGGLQRQIWTGEAWMMIEALCRIGDFRDYLEPVMELYFQTFQQENGEIVPFGIPWAMATGTVLFSFAKYARSAGKATWDKFREQAYRAFCWIQETRVKETTTDSNGACILKGLFPPRRSCDAEFVFQAWTLTDASILYGLEAYTEAAEYFEDENRLEIRAGYEDYLATMRGYWNEVKQQFGDSDELEVPYSLTIPNERMHNNFFFGVAGAVMLYSIHAEENDYARVRRQYDACERRHGGLYSRLKDIVSYGSGKYNLDENGKCIVWYVCCEEYFWFRAFLHLGDRKHAEEILRDNFRYAMTDEYQMIERYKKTDPYFVPWMPNASANGRTVSMLLDFYS